MAAVGSGRSELFSVEKNNIKQQNISKRLLELDCPFIEDDEALTYSLFEPSEARIRILVWLIGKFDHKLGDLITKHSPAAENHIDSRMQRMLFACNMMGLCNASDLELIKGTASKRKQMAFWENLIDLVFTSDSMNHPVKKYKQIMTESFGYASDGSPEIHHGHSKEYYESLCGLTDNLVRQENIKDMFSSSVILFPPDLEKLFVNDDRKASTSAPDINVLSNIAEKLAAEENAAHKEFAMSRERLQGPELCQNEIDQLCKKLSLAITMLKQLITNFLHSYEIDLKQWCNRPKAKKSVLGPTSRRTFQMAMKQDELLGQMKVLEAAYQTINCRISEQLNIRKANTEIGHDALMNLRQVVDVLRESELRIKDVW